MSKRIVDLFYSRMTKYAQSDNDAGVAAAMPSGSMEAGGIAQDEGVDLRTDADKRASPYPAESNRKQLFNAQIELNRIQEALNFINKQDPSAVFNGDLPYGGKTFGELANIFSSQFEEANETVRILSNRGGPNNDTFNE